MRKSERFWTNTWRKLGLRLRKLSERNLNRPKWNVWQFRCDVFEPQKLLTGNPFIQIHSTTVTEGTSAVNVYVTLTEPTTDLVTFQYATSDGTANSTAGADYTATSGTLSILPGSVSASFAVNITDDSIDEESENFSVSIFSITSATISTSQALVTIYDNDTASVSVSDAAPVVEGNESTFTIGLSTPSDRSVIVYFQTVDDTAIQGAGDYTGLTSSVIFAPGQTAKTVIVETLDDAIDEPNQDFQLSVTSVTNAVLADGVGIGTIVDDDMPPAASISGAAKVNEGQFAVFTIAISSQSDKTSKVSYTTSNGTAVAEGDYDSHTGTVTFAPEDPLTKTILIQTNLDEVRHESDETFYVSLAAPTVWPPSPSEDSTESDLPLGYPSYAIGTIADVSEKWKVNVAATNVYGAERNEGSDKVVFTISRPENRTTGDVTVTYSISTASGPNHAISGTDFTGADTSLVLANGQASGDVTITPNDDSTVEWDEDIIITLTGIDISSTLDYEFGESTLATGYILDDDGIEQQASRNVDASSTGNSREVISNGTIYVGIQEGDVGLALAPQIGALAPTYRSNDNLHPILYVDMKLPGTPSVLSGKLYVGGRPGTSVTFDNVGSLSSTSDIYRFVIQGADDIADYLRTGNHEYAIEFSATVSGIEVTRTIRGTTEIVNLVGDTYGETQFGKRWWINGLDRIKAGDGTINTDSTDNAALLNAMGAATESGFALVRGDNSSGWYKAEVDSEAIEIINDSDADRTGTWNTGNYAGGHSSGYRYASTGSTASAAWKFEELEDKKIYQVFVTWVPGATRATNAEYTVTGGTNMQTGNAETVVTVNQRFTPGETVVSGTQWRSLGFYALGEEEDELTVTLDATGADGEVVADAVMLVSAWNITTPDGSFNRLVTGDPTAQDLGGYYLDSGFTPDEEAIFSLIDKYGGVAEFDAAGRIITRTDRNGNRVKFDYDSDYKAILTTVTTQGNLKTELNYSGSGDSRKLSTIVDLAGVADGSATISYGISDGLLETIAYPDAGDGSPSTTFDYDDDDLLTKVVDAENATTTIAYDSVTHRATSVTNADSNFWSIDAQLTDGLKSSSAEAEGRKAPTGNFGTEGVDQQKAVYTDARGNDWKFQTDRYGLAIGKELPTSGEEDPALFLWMRDAHGLVTEYVQPDGGGGEGAQTTTFAYDQDAAGAPLTHAKGLLTEVTYADSTTEKYEYDTSFSVMTKHTDQIGRVNEYDLDARGNVTTITENVGGDITRVTEYEYTAAPEDIEDLAGGMVTDQTIAADTADAVSISTQYFTDAAKIGLVEFVLVNGVSVKTKYDYDARRRVKSQTLELEEEDGDDRVTEYDYDVLDRLTTITLQNPGTGDHGTTSITYQYDKVGNRTEVTDQRGNTTITEYDQMRRVETITLPGPGTDQHHADTYTGSLTTTYEYDENGNLKTVTAPGTLDTQYTYNARNLATDVEGEESVTAHNKYDSWGNVKETEDSRGAHTKYEYDKLGRRVKILSPNAADGTATGPVTVYKRDDLGRVEEIHHPGYEENSAIKTVYAYDGLGRQVSVAQPPDYDSRIATTHYFYDLRDNVIIVINAAKQATFTEYDDLNRPVEVTDLNPQTAGLGIIKTTFVYNAASEVLRTSVYNSASPGTTRDTTTQYDNLGRVIEVAGPDPDGAGELDSVITTYNYDANGNTRFVTQYAGSSSPQITEYLYDDLNRNWKIILPEVSVFGVAMQQDVVIAFDASMDAVKTTEKIGETDLGAPITRTYTTAFDGQHRVKDQFLPSVTAGTPTISTAYEPNGESVTRTNARGYATVQNVDYRGRGTSTVLPSTAAHDSPTFQQFFDIYDRVIKTSEQIGEFLFRETSSVFDLASNLLSETIGKIVDYSCPSTPVVVDPGITYHYAYDILGNRISATDGNGKITRFVLDGAGRQSMVIEPQAEGGIPADATVNDADSDYDETSGSGWGNSAETTGYDGSSRQAEILTTADDHVAEWNFTVNSGKTYMVLVSWAAHEDNATAAQYTVFDGATQEEQIAVDQTLAPFGFNDDGHTWLALGSYTITDVGGALKVTLSADSTLDAGKILSADAIRVVEVGPVTRYTYDAFGQLATVTDPNGRVTTNFYDDAGRLIKILSPDPDGAGPEVAPFTQFELDTAGNVITSTNAKGDVWRYEYDELFRKIKETNPNDEETLYRYDLIGRLVQLEDASGNITYFVYDDRDQLVEQTIVVDSVELVTSYEYDLSGNRTRIVDRNGHVRDFTYDELDRVQTETWYVDVADADLEDNAQNVIEYAYDIASQLLEIQDFNSHYEYAYNGRGQVTQITINNYGMPEVILTQGFDADTDQRIRLAANIGGDDDFENLYEYDDLQRLKSVIQQGQSGGNAVAEKRVDFRYLADGRYDAIERYADIAGTDLVASSGYLYDDAGRLTSLVHAKGLTALATYGWTFDAAGRITQFTSTDGVVDYAYDDLGQLTGADYDYQTDEEYEYDATGNRIETQYQDEVPLDEDGFWKFDETSGTNANDESTNNHDGTLAGNASFTTTGLAPIAGNAAAVALDGSGDYVSMGNQTALKIGTGDLTVSGWFYLTSENNNTSKAIIDQGNAATSGGSGYQVYYVTGVNDDRHLVFRINNGSGAAQELKVKVPNGIAGEWHHVAVSVDNPGNIIFYYDGIEVARATNAETGNVLGSLAFTVGAAASQTQYYWNGKIDDVRVYHRVLSAAEVADVKEGRTGLDASDYATGDHNRLSSDGRFNYEYDDSGNRTVRVDTQTGIRTEYKWDIANRLIEVKTIEPTENVHLVRAVTAQGDVIRDARGSIHDGYLEGDANWSASDLPSATGISHAMVFDGFEDYAVLGNDNLFDVDGQDLSIGMWFKPTTSGGSYQTLFSFGVGFASGSLGYEISYSDLTDTLRLRINDGTSLFQTVSYSVPISLASSWHHLALTVDFNGQIKIYLNGTQVVSATNTQTGNSDAKFPFVLGAIAANNAGQLSIAQAFTGKIADVRVYKRLLSSGEITGLQTSAAPITQVTEIVKYVYDVYGNRIGKYIDENGDNSFDKAAAYVWDGADEILRFTSDDGTLPDEASSLTNRYLWGQQLDELLADERLIDDVLGGHMLNMAGNVVWPLADHQQSIRDLVQYDAGLDSTDVVKHVTYDAFGNTTADSAPSVELLFRYTSQEFDSETGLYYYDARYYDPQTGQFVSPDNVDDDLPNPYRLVVNGTPNATDPTGNELFVQGEQARQAVIRWFQEDIGITPDTIKLPGFQSVYWVGMPSSDWRTVRYYLDRGYDRSGNKLDNFEKSLYLGATRTSDHFLVYPNEEGTYTIASDTLTDLHAEDLDVMIKMTALYGYDVNAIVESYKSQLTSGWHTFWVNLVGGLQILGGAAEIGAGVALTKGTLGFGAILGIPVAVHGADNMVAGQQTLATQQIQRTQTSQLLDNVTGNKEYSDTIDGLLSAAGGFAALRQQMARTGGAITAANIDELLARVKVPKNVVGNSELGNALSDLGTNPLGRNLNHLDEFGQGAGFSGVIDADSGKFLAYASGETKLANGAKPLNLVDQYGGHQQVNAALSGVLGNTSKNRLGFSMVLDAQGNFAVKFNSGINSANPNVLARTVPESMRQQILNAISKSTGRKAYSVQ